MSAPSGERAHKDRVYELGGFQALGLPFDDLPPKLQAEFHHAAQQDGCDLDLCTLNVSDRLRAHHSEQSHLPATAFRLRVRLVAGRRMVECSPGDYVGHIALTPSLVLHVHPKLRHGGDEPLFSIETLDMLHALLIRYSGERRRLLRLTEQCAFEVSHTPVLLESLVIMLVRSVRQLVSIGVASRTTTERTSGPCLRGAFDLPAQLNQRPHTVAARFYSPVHSKRLMHSKDLESNRRLKAALLHASHQDMLSAELRSCAAALASEFFGGVSERKYGAHVPEVLPGQAPEHYTDALWLAELTLRSSPQGAPGQALRGFELLQPGWCMWEAAMRAALDASLLQARARGDRSLRLTKTGGVVFGDRGSGDDNGVERFQNPQRKKRRLGRVYPDLLVCLDNGQSISKAGVLVGDVKYFEAYESSDMDKLLRDRQSLCTKGACNCILVYAGVPPADAKGKIEGLQRSKSGLWVGVERVQVRPSEPAEAAVVVLAFDLADKSGKPRPPKELENQVATFTSLAQQVLLCNLRSCWLLDSLLESDGEKPTPLLMYDFDVQQERLVLETQAEDAFKVYVKEIVDAQSKDAFVSARRFGALPALVDGELSLHTLMDSILLELLTDEHGNVWRSEGHEWIGAYVAAANPGTTEVVNGKIFRWLPAAKDENALWTVKYVDGVTDDFEEEEVEETIALYKVAQGSVWKSEGHEWIGEHVASVLLGKWEVVVGRVWRWLPPDVEHPNALWKVVYLDGYIEDLDEKGVERGIELYKAEQGIVWKSEGHERIGEFVERWDRATRAGVVGKIWRWRPADEEKRNALWKVVHLDGDIEDLDEKDVEAGIKQYEARPGAGKQRKPGVSKDGGSSSKLSKQPQGRPPLGYKWDATLGSWVDANGNPRTAKRKRPTEAGSRSKRKLFNREIPEHSGTKAALGWAEFHVYGTGGRAVAGIYVCNHADVSKATDWRLILKKTWVKAGFGYPDYRAASKKGKAKKAAATRKGPEEAAEQEALAAEEDEDDDDEEEDDDEPLESADEDDGGDDDDDDGGGVTSRRSAGKKNPLQPKRKAKAGASKDGRRIRAARAKPSANFVRGSQTALAPHIKGVDQYSGTKAALGWAEFHVYGSGGPAGAGIYVCNHADVSKATDRRLILKKTWVEAGDYGEYKPALEEGKEKKAAAMRKGASSKEEEEADEEEESSAAAEEAEGEGGEEEKEEEEDMEEQDDDDDDDDDDSGGGGGSGKEDWSHLEVGEAALTDKHPEPLKPGKTDVCVMQAAFPDYKIKHAASVGWRGRVTEMRDSYGIREVKVFEKWMDLDEETDIRPIAQSSWYIALARGSVCP